MKNFLLMLGASLVLLNFVIIYFFDDIVDRTAMFASTVIFFLIYTIKTKPEIKPLVAFSLLLLCDAALIYYEEPVFMAVTYITRILAYAILICVVACDLEKIKFGKFQIFVSALIFALNIYLITSLVEMVPEATNAVFFKFLFYVYVITLLIFGVVAITYHSRYLNMKSLYFLCASLSFILSDLLYYILYYLEFDFYTYPDRFFNIAALACLVIFLSTRKSMNSTDESAAELI